jgi:hypothetical protein
MVCELLAWMQMLALAGPARSREPKRVRLRVFTWPGSWSAATAFSDCTWPPLALVRIYHRSPHISPPRSSVWRPSGLADQPKPSLRTEERAMACRTRPPCTTGRDRVGQIKHPANASATTKFAKSSGLEPVFGVDDCIPHDGFFTRTMVSPVCYSR